MDRRIMREIEPTIHVDLDRGETYADYLCLDILLSAQQPRTAPDVDHDEMLFIIQHQTSELWMKLMIHELDEALNQIRHDRLKQAFKTFARVGHIQRMLFEQWSVLETLTPNEFLQFRDSLGRSSGFQSSQYRTIEFLLGNKNAQLLAPHAHTPNVHAELERRLTSPSVYDEFLRWLARHGHDVPDECVERDWSQPYEAHPQLVEVFRRIYESTEDFWHEYDMCEKLVDVEERFQLWRFRHMITVRRIIGHKRGTGGSSGVGFLEKALELTFFPELWDVRTELKLNPRTHA